jgi:hypothetical protein
MKSPRVKRGPGPKSKMLTKATYRKKALPFLLHDFERRCAYCLDPDDFRHSSQTHVEHFNCKLQGRKRHQYKNLMLGCAACNMSKHDKPVVNPFDRSQRLLNCTEETEFPAHIRETADGQWEARTPEGEYHLASIGLQERCHQLKRGERQRMAQRCFALLTQAIQYQSYNPAALHNQLLGTVRDILGLLERFPPLVTDQGVLTVREWLIGQGVDPKLIRDASQQDS